MAEEDVIIVDSNGDEHVFPKGFDPVVAGRIVREASQPRRLGNAKTGGYASDDPNLKPDPAALWNGAASNFNPRTYLNAVTAIPQAIAQEWWKQPLGDRVQPFSIPTAIGTTMVKGGANMVGTMLNAGTPEGKGSETVGALLGAPLPAAVARNTGRLLRYSGPAVMDMGLQRTMADRLEFPNTPKQLVDDGIVPTGTNVQDALTAAEERVAGIVRAYDDAARSTDTGRMLPPGRVAVPLGEAPMPSHGQPAVTRPDVRMRPVQVPPGPLMDRSGLDQILRQRTELGPTAGTIPDRLFGASPADVRTANEMGAGAHALPTRSAYGEPARGGLDYQPQYLSSPVGPAQGDVVAGPGVVLQPRQNWRPGDPRIPGAAPTMTDPERIAQAAASHATRRGRVAGLGDTPGPEAADIAAAQNRYLAQNTRPQTMSESLAQKRAYGARGRWDSRPNAPVQTNENVNFNEGVALAQRRNLIERMPSLEGELRREENLMGAKIAQDKMAAKATPLSTVGTIKTAMGLRSPAIMGRAAIGMDRTGRTLMNVSPELLRAAILAQMGRSVPPENPQGR